MTDYRYFGRSNFVFTSESVSDGHPDKVCDQISDAILDLFLKQNPQARAAVETMTTTNRVAIAGEMRDIGGLGNDDIEAVIRETIKSIGYEQNGFHWRDAEIDIYLHSQSADIAVGVDSSENKDEGAGDQGIMFGFACDETDELMPAPIHYAHQLLRELKTLREGEGRGKLGPDAKSQISLRYENGRPVEATSIVLSTQHALDVDQEEVQSIVRPMITRTLPDSWVTDKTEFFINPTGRFIIGGPDGDAGLTGRKIIVDTYGGAAPHGGGAFSGKDATKVDRSAAYAARYLAKNVVASGLARRCIIQLSYAIGISKPTSFYLTTEGTGEVPDRELEKLLPQLMDLTPRGIREHLQLNRPIYLRTASFGHFGRAPEEDGGFSWEKTDMADAIRSHFGS